MRQVLCGNPLAGVGYSNLRLVVYPVDSNIDRAARWSEFDRVRQQIRKHTLNLHAIELAGAAFAPGMKCQLYLAAFRGDLELIRSVIGQFHQIERLPL